MSNLLPILWLALMFVCGFPLFGPWVFLIMVASVIAGLVASQRHARRNQDAPWLNNPHFKG